MLIRSPRPASRRRDGTTSRRMATRLPAISVPADDKPVTLPPGRAMLWISPVPTGSPAHMTIGICPVADFAARAAGVCQATMRSVLLWTKSAASSASRLSLPSADRNSRLKSRPSIRPTLRSPLRNSRTKALGSLFPSTRTPIRCTLTCARAWSDHAASAPSNKMSLRLIRSPRRRARGVWTEWRGQERSFDHRVSTKQECLWEL